MKKFDYMKDEITNYSNRNINVYIDSVDVTKINPYYLDFIFEDTDYMQDISVSEGGKIEEINYVKISTY